MQSVQKPKSINSRLMERALKKRKQMKARALGLIVTPKMPSYIATATATATEDWLSDEQACERTSEYFDAPELSPEQSAVFDKDSRGAVKRERLSRTKWGRQVAKLAQTDIDLLLPPKPSEPAPPRLGRWGIVGDRSRKHADAVALPGHSRFVHSAVNLPRVRTRSSDRTPKRMRTRAGINKGNSHGSTCGYCWPKIGTRMTAYANARRFAREIQYQGQSDLTTDLLTDLMEQTLPEIVSEMDDHALQMWTTEGKVFCWGCGEWSAPQCTQCGKQNHLPDADLDVPRSRTLDLSILVK